MNARNGNEVEVAITNGAPYARDGFAEVPWSEVVAKSRGITPQSVEVTFNGNPVPFQVDDVENDAASARLVFWLWNVPAGDEHYRTATTRVTVRPVRPEERKTWPVGQAANPTGNGVQLVGSVLDLWLSTAARPWPEDRTWFAGAATTVQVRKREFLDLNAGWWGHDPEKRAMQIDRIRIWRPPWDDYEPTCCDFPHHDRDYELVASGTGPVRAWATMRTRKPFPFDFRDLTENRRRAYNCQLYRTVSLFADADFVYEELYVRASPDHFSGPGTLAFAARYFMSAHLGLLPDVRHDPAIPDWFGVGSDMPPYPGYGFATDAHTHSFSNPPVYYPRPEAEAHKGFEWETAAAPRVRALHLYRLNISAAEIGHATGELWFTYILKPLRARVVV